PSNNLFARLDIIGLAESSAAHIAHIEQMDLAIFSDHLALTVEDDGDVFNTLFTRNFRENGTRLQADIVALGEGLRHPERWRFNQWLCERRRSFLIEAVIAEIFRQDE